MTKNKNISQMDILLDEKDAAVKILKELKKEKIFDDTFKEIRIYRNRIVREIRELNAKLNEKK